MRCPSCGTDNRAGRKFCSSCGAALALVCPSCGSPNEQGERFCGECGAPLESQDAPAAAQAVTARGAVPPAPGPEEERRVATILFADLAGFTSMSEGMDPEAVKALAAHCATLMSAEVRRFGGTVSSVMGDAIMAMFGAPVAHEDDAERAIRAAAAMRERIEAVENAPKRLQLHVGINTGETLAGLIGPDEARDYTAMGDTTNTAARLMSAAPAGSIYVGEKTFAAISHSVECREVEPVQAKGKAEPVRVWEVVDVPVVPAARPMGSAPFVGRESELNQLSDLWLSARRTREPVLALVLGPPGIGKTRFLEEFTSRASGEPRVLRGRCLPYGEGITYWPITEMLETAAEILHDDPPEATADKLGAFLEGLGTEDLDQLRTMATAVSTLFAVAATPRGTYRTGEITQGELHWGIRRIFELMAATRPLILVFEDLHWAERTLLDLVEFVLNGARGAPVLLVGSARPELADSWQGATADERRAVIPLQALTDREGEMLVASLFPAATGRPQTPLLRAAGGNPLFLEETVRMLSDAGKLGEEGWSGGEESVPVAGSLQTLIGSRLDLLPAHERQVAQLASIGGLVFWSGLVTFLGDHANGDGDVTQRLRLLEQRDLIRGHDVSTVAGEREWAFKHMLIRDVAYGRLPKARRSELHARCAGWVSDLSKSDEEFVEIVAYHLETACTLARELGTAPPAATVSGATAALAAAGAKAERREGIHEADRFYLRALDVAGSDSPETATELRLRRSRTLTALGRLTEATELLSTVAEDARQLARIDLRGQALVQLANVAQKVGQATDARRHLVEARSIALDQGDLVLQVRAAYEAASVQADFEGAADAALDDLWLGLAIADQLDDLGLRTEGHLRLGTVLATSGRLAEARRELERCAALADETGSYRDDARATYLLAYVTYYLGDPVEAERLAAKAAEWLDRTADRYFQIQNSLLLSRMALTRDDLDESERWARVALPLAQELGGWLLVEACRHLTEALVLRGDTDEADRTADVAEAGVPEEDAFAAGESRLARGLVAAARAGASAASMLDEALGAMEGQGVPIELAEARISAARVMLLVGERGTAERMLRKAREDAEGTEAHRVVEIADTLLARAP